MSQYTIGQLNITWINGAFNLPEDDFSALFRREDEIRTPDVLLEGREMDLSWFHNSQCLKKTGGYELLRTDRGLFLMNHWGACRYGYGIWLDELFGSNLLPVYFSQEFSSQVPLHMTRFLSTIGLHSKLLQKNAPVLHASFVDYKGRAILFTAPAQTGKSTQAKLWESFAGAEIINGDRVLLSRRGDTWLAHGYPCCGSSTICVNRTLPVAAIVVLSQDQYNTVSSMKLSEQVISLVSATEVYPWENREVNLSFDTAQQIAQQVPVVRLACRPDAGAVDVLKAYLEDQKYVDCF